MKVSYSIIKNRVSSHCITWLYRKKRHRKFFNNRIEALLFKHQKEAELGYRENSEIDLELFFNLVYEINNKLETIEARLDAIERSSSSHEKALTGMRKRPAPKVLKVSEAAKVLRISPRKLYYLLDKGVFKRYKLPHTRSTFIKLEEVEKALGSGSIDELID